MPKVLLVANVAKEHVLKFHVPTIKHLTEQGWMVDVACGGKEEVPYCRNQYELPIDRSPFKTHFLNAVRQLKKVIEEEGYDIVYCHTTVGGIVARLAANEFRKQGVRVVKFAHGTYFYKGAPLLNWIYYPLYKLMSWMTDDLITITEEDFAFSTKHFPHCKVYYVPGIGVDPDRFRITDRENTRKRYRQELNIPTDATVCIYVAELIKNKNQILLLDALRCLKEKGKEKVYLLLVGPDHTNGEYAAYAEKLGVYGHIRFLGWRSDIKELYATSDICTASSIREGLGLNIVEAMTCGIPVIATANSGHRAVIESDKNGVLVPIFDSNEMARQIARLSTDAQLRTSLVKASLSDISKYYNDNVLAKLADILENRT